MIARTVPVLAGDLTSTPVGLAEITEVSIVALTTEPTIPTVSLRKPTLLLFWIRVLAIVTVAVKPAGGSTNTPPERAVAALPLLVMLTMFSTSVELPGCAVETRLTPKPLPKPVMVELRIVTVPPDRILTPLTPVPRPSKYRPLSVTELVDGTLMMIPLVPLTRTPACCMPAHTIWIDLVMGTAPKPPGSMQLISPPAAVLARVPWKVLHGAVRLHGLASSPTPDTQVRVACAEAGATNSTEPVITAKNNAIRLNTDI